MNLFESSDVEKTYSYVTFSQYLLSKKNYISRANDIAFEMDKKLSVINSKLMPSDKVEDVQLNLILSLNRKTKNIVGFIMNPSIIEDSFTINNLDERFNPIATINPLSNFINHVYDHTDEKIVANHKLIYVENSNYTYLEFEATKLFFEINEIN